MIEVRTSGESRMAAAKAKLTEAARATLAGDPKAAGLAKTALDELQSARAELQSLANQSRSA